MSKQKVTPPKSIKARGALVVPRVSPDRRTLVWYRRKGWIVVLSILLVSALTGGTVGAFKISGNLKERKDKRRQVVLFETAVNALQRPFQQVLGDMNNAPQEFAAGKLPADDYQKLADTWVEEFRKLLFGLKDRKIPANLPGLEIARANFVQGTVLYIDGAKLYSLAAGLHKDPEKRDAAITQARNIVSHATSVYGLGQRRLTNLKKEFGVKGADDAAKLLGPIPLPEEEVTPPPPPGFEDALQDAAQDLQQGQAPPPPPPP